MTVNMHSIFNLFRRVLSIKKKQTKLQRLSSPQRSGADD